MKVLLITACPPIPSWGGAMAFYRHFCERDDFQISVVTDNRQLQSYTVPYDYSIINRGRLWQRCAKTRLGKAAHSWSHLGGGAVPEQVIQQAKDFGAEAIFTVGGSWSWMSKLAERVAECLSLPLVASFNDWWNYHSLRYRWLDPLIERQFRQLYRRCDLALCTSEGMRDALGAHNNAVVLYPTGAEMKNSLSGAIIRDCTQRPFTVAFAGNLGDWYGRMLESVVTQSWQRNDNISFKLFGSNASWSKDFDSAVKEKGLFHGQVPFESLRAQMQAVDALLLLMGFDQSCAQIEKTSFKTKFLDYLSFQKPILLWGPDYCSAVKIAREFDSAEICLSEAAHDYLERIVRVRENSARQRQLVANAERMYVERFHPDKIHRVLVQSMKALTA